VTRGFRARITAIFLGLGLLGGACSSRPVSPAVGGEPEPDTIEFVFGTTEGGEFSSRASRGRATAVLFVTTYDLASQLVARRLDDVVRSRRPRANAGAVVLEPPKYALLADAFRTSLNLSYPVAIADDDTRLQSGPFGRIDRVPTLVVLDRSSREVWRKPGALSEQEIDEALAKGGQSGSDWVP
jgi:hypothetical protein